MNKVWTDCNGRPLQIGDTVKTNDWREGKLVSFGFDGWHNVRYPDGYTMRYNKERLLFVRREEE
jgi:hypothetical protein